MAAKKKSAKRPPRQVFIKIAGINNVVCQVSTRRKDLHVVCDDERIVGPYVLAERMRER